MKTIYAALTAFGCAFAGSASAQREGLALYLPFDEGRGDVVKDIAGGGHQGVLLNGVQWTEGKFGKALQFSGKSYVEVPDKPGSGFDGVEGLTIQAWVKQSAHHDNGIVVKLTTGAFWPCSYNLETWSDGNIWFGVDQDAKAIAAGGYPFGEWFHIAGVFDGKARKQTLYLNGKAVASGDATTNKVPDGDKPVWIGTVDPANYPFQGALDEIAIYSRALTANEILDDMKGLTLAVEPRGKSAAAWGRLKSRN